MMILQKYLRWAIISLDICENNEFMYSSIPDIEVAVQPKIRVIIWQQA